MAARSGFSASTKLRFFVHSAQHISPLFESKIWHSVATIFAADCTIFTLRRADSSPAVFLPTSRTFFSPISSIHVGHFLSNCPLSAGDDHHLASSQSSLSLLSVHAHRNLSTAAEQGVDQTCWACESRAPPGAFLICPSCSAVQPLDPSVDHFQIFESDRVYRLDIKELEKKYKSLQKKLHPDLFSRKSKREQAYSAAQSSHVIQAYYTLLRPLSRARYLLGLHGFKIEEEGTVTDHGLLMEIMETRESIEEAKDASELRRLLENNKERMHATEDVLVDAFEKNDLAAAKEAVQRMSYYQRVAEEIQEKL